MFGQNPIRSVVTDPYQLAVESVFYTLQGEGPYSGRPALFIRMAGCNLACHFCDTQFESQAERLQHVDGIVARILGDFTVQQRRFVVLTGGEPLRQNISTLCERLLATGTNLIQVETAGTAWQSGLDHMLFGDWPRLVLVCSPKTPKVRPEVERFCRHYKYVVRAGDLAEPGDGLPCMGTQVATQGMIQHLYRPSGYYFGVGEGGPITIWVSPMDEYHTEKNRANMEAARDACLKHGYRLSLQVHKLVGVE